MFNMFAVIWNVDDSRQCAAARFLAGQLLAHEPSWRRAFEASGMTILCESRNPPGHDSCLLSDGQGVVLGTLFTNVAETEVPRRVTTLGAKESETIVRSEGRALLASHWGQYVAFLLDPQTRQKYVIRDPSGRIDCLTTTYEDVRVYFSGARSFAALHWLRFTINWNYIAASLCGTLPDTRSTGLNEVARLLPGECAVIDDRVGVRTARHWSPIAFVSNSDADRDSAAAQLRMVTQRCVNAWVGVHQRIMHMLSGGLDSAIVSSCLKAAPNNPHLLCINNHYARSAEGDERPYARLVAEHFDMPLIECSASPQVDLKQLPPMPATACPTNFIQPYAIGSFINRIAASHNVTALSSGLGGDEVFGRGAPIYACADSLFRSRITVAALDFAFSAARLRHISAFRALREGVRGALARSTTSILPKPKVSPLINAAAIEPSSVRNLFAPEWLSEGARVPPGKAWQILSLSYGMRDIGLPFVSPDAPSEVDPLLSQPLIELCLGFPTELLAAGGWDRSIARRAFASELPSAITWRRDKGVVDEYLKDLVTHNLPFLRELLHDGFLVKERLVQVTNLERVLANSLNTGFGFPLELCRLASTEIWIRKWMHEQHRPAFAA